MSAIYVALAAAQCWADGTLYRRGKAERGPRLSEMDHRVIHWRVLVGEPVAHVFFGEPVSTPGSSPGAGFRRDMRWRPSVAGMGARQKSRYVRNGPETGLKVRALTNDAMGQELP